MFISLGKVQRFQTSPNLFIPDLETPAKSQEKDHTWIVVVYSRVLIPNRIRLFPVPEISISSPFLIRSNHFLPIVSPLISLTTFINGAI
jgi:hypothetical protein